jgi:hypothetical protein
MDSPGCKCLVDLQCSISGRSHVLCGSLDDIHRISERGYEPSDDDIIRVRSTTPGFQEYHLTVETGGCQSFVAPTRIHAVALVTDLCLGKEAGNEWILYDVGYSRSSVRIPSLCWTASFS